MFGLNKYFHIIKSSGVNTNNICSYLTLEVKDGLTVVTRKEITYDRKKFEKSIKAVSYPKREHMAEHLLGINLNK